MALRFGIYVCGDNPTNTASCCFIYSSNFESGFLIPPQETVWDGTYIIEFANHNHVIFKSGVRVSKLYLFKLVGS